MSSEPSSTNPIPHSSHKRDLEDPIDHQELHDYANRSIDYLDRRLSKIETRLNHLERPPREPSPEERLSALDPRSDPGARMEIILELLEYTIRHNNRLLEEQAKDRTRGPGDHPPPHIPA